MPQETTYSARHSTPDWIQRGVQQTIALPVYSNGALAAPSSGTVSVYDSGGIAIVDAQAVTVSAQVATYTIAAVTLPDTLALSDRWLEVWTLTMPDGRAYTFRRDAGLVRGRLYPVVSDVDLTRMHTELREWMAQDQTSLQNYVDAAWDDVVLRLIEDSRWPYLILSPWSLRSAHTWLALSYTFRDYASSAAGAGDKYSALAQHYMEQAEKAFGRLRLTYDFDQDAVVDPDDVGVSGQSVLMTNAPPSWERWPQ